MEINLSIKEKGMLVEKKREVDEALLEKF